jgi:hypothetical protein
MGRFTRNPNMALDFIFDLVLVKKSDKNQKWLVFEIWQYLVIEQIIYLYTIRCSFSSATRLPDRNFMIIRLMNRVNSKYCKIWSKNHAISDEKLCKVFWLVGQRSDASKNTCTFCTFRVLSISTGFWWPYLDFYLYFQTSIFLLQVLVLKYRKNTFTFT